MASSPPIPTDALREPLPVVEADALENLLVAAAVNKRLLMRILAQLQGGSLDALHDEVAGMDREFRAIVKAGMERMPPRTPEGPVAPGELPVGREEERRGHQLDQQLSHTAADDLPIGRDTSSRRSRSDGPQGA